LLDSKETHIHIHIHEGVSPEVAGRVITALEALTGREDEVTIALGKSDDAEDSGAAGLVRTAYNESTGRAKAMLEYLAENPGQPVPYGEVAAALDLESARALPGMLGSFTRRAQNQYGGFKPFESVRIGNQWYLKMPVEVAKVVIKLS
jgi:hypothetical protein